MKPALPYFTVTKLGDDQKIRKRAEHPITLGLFREICTAPTPCTSVGRVSRKSNTNLARSVLTECYATWLNRVTTMLPVAIHPRTQILSNARSNFPTPFLLSIHRMKKDSLPLWGCHVESGSVNGGRGEYWSFSFFFASIPRCPRPLDGTRIDRRGTKGREGEQTSEYNPEIWISDAVRVALARINTWKMEGCNEIIADLRVYVHSLESVGWVSLAWIRYFRLGDRYSSHVVNIARRIESNQWSIQVAM